MATIPKPGKSAVLVNESANDGNAARRWLEVKYEVAERLPEGTQFFYFKTPFDTRPLVKKLLAEGVDCFISAGGDGSAHHLLNLLLRLTCERAGHLFLGGIGLGSSNDFVKPQQHFIQKIPVRIGLGNPVLADVGKVVFTAPDGQRAIRYFIANASLGITAEANWLFNREDRFIHFTKKRWPEWAIRYTAVKAILAYKNFPVELHFDGTEKNILLSNLAVLKNPHVSGKFCYDQAILPDDGLLGLNFCDGMGKFELVRTLTALGRGHFAGRPKTFSATVESLAVHTGGPRSLEMDGEVVQARDMRFRVLPSAVHLLGL